ncbi:MAG: hypothetical protein GXO27_01610 [Chlorobi bacterium]|nr:hypothetical protein [Chlorobiota bacterium]
MSGESPRRVTVAVATGRPGKRIAGHLGRARHFWLYRIEERPGGMPEVTSKQMAELDEDNTLHAVLHRFPIDFSGHPLEEADIILAGGMGMGAIQKLFLVGKRAYPVAEKDPDEAIRKLIEGTLQSLPPDAHGHGHHHHHHDEE